MVVRLGISWPSGFREFKHTHTHTHTHTKFLANIKMELKHTHTHTHTHTHIKFLANIKMELIHVLEIVLTGIQQM